MLLEMAKQRPALHANSSSAVSAWGSSRKTSSRWDRSPEGIRHEFHEFSRIPNSVPKFVPIRAIRVTRALPDREYSIATGCTACEAAQPAILRATHLRHFADGTVIF